MQLTRYIMLALVLGFSISTACSGGEDFIDGDADIDIDADSDGDVDGDTDGDGDTDVDSDGDGDADIDADFDEDFADVESMHGCPGHAEMALLPSLDICIDRFEASEGRGGRAVAIAGVRPWDHVSWERANAACAAAGKRLCTSAEWTAACRGPDDLRFPYGPFYQDFACNGGDLETGRTTETGSLPDCEGGYPGIFDMSANVWEWVQECPSAECEVRGGSYYDIFASRVHCNSSDTRDGTSEVANIGFRCCLSL